MINKICKKIADLIIALLVFIGILPPVALGGIVIKKPFPHTHRLKLPAIILEDTIVDTAIHLPESVSIYIWINDSNYWKMGYLKLDTIKVKSILINGKPTIDTALYAKNALSKIDSAKYSDTATVALKAKGIQKSAEKLTNVFSLNLEKIFI